jgi:flagellar hook-associated protein 3 FlgL
MMRISDILISNNYLNRLSGTKANIERLSRQIASGVKVSKPSDSPSGTSKILKFYNKLTQSEVYTNNIHNSLASLKETTFAMENIQSEVITILTNITELNNAANNEDLNSFADKIDLSLNAILNSANSEYDGKYLFGGTDFSSAPYGFTEDLSAIELKVGDVSGIQRVKISQNTLQKINMTGAEVFGTIGEDDIFNTLIEIRDNLRLGIKPTEEQETIIKNFNKKVLDKIAGTGNIINQLTDAEELLNNQKLNIEELLSNEQEVDVTKAIMELQSQDYILQVTYQLSAMFLPKSILDYL